MTELKDRLSLALADHYALERELGRGGMATVYLAHDLKHDRPVALKVLHPELANGIGSERFLREISVAARLQHPHILPLHDSGASQDDFWYTMPFVDGESLRERLKREVQLPVEDAVRLTSEVAEALEYAHGQGIVHRDIKPENVLLSRGHALVADFGVAQALGSAGAEKLTETGVALGTPMYMSPEQASGAQVDGRSDIYSLGCVLYEMLAGEPPFTGPTPMALIARRLTESPRPLSATRERLPPGLEEIVHQALARIPADRFASAWEFRTRLEALPRLKVSGAGAALSGAGAERSTPNLVPSSSGPLGTRLATLATGLRERRTVQVGLVYAGAAYVLVEAASVILPALHAPEWLLTLLVVFALFGFPIALVLAWAMAFDSAERTAGASRTDTSSYGARGRLITGLGLSVVLLAAAGAFFLWRQRTGHERAASTVDSKPQPGDLRSVAVLPFENLGDSADSYFADGITDEVRGKLAALPGLLVIARASSGQYKQTTKSPQQIGRELGAQYLLTGTVRWEKAAGLSRVRVSPELVHVATGSTKWQEPFETPLTDVFQVQADLATRVAGALGVALGAGERERLDERPTENFQAYDAFLKGVDADAKGAGTYDLAALRRAMDYYQRAVALDSTFALAWAKLSQTHSVTYWVAPTAAGATAARQAGERAVALAPKRPEGYMAMVFYYDFVLHDRARTNDAFLQALQLAPRDPQLLLAVARTVMATRPEEALAHVRNAQVIDPRSVETAAEVAGELIALRRHDEALQAANRGLALAPANLRVIHVKVEAHLAQGDLAGARATLRAVPREVDPAALVAFMANWDDLYWVLDDAQQRLLLRLSPAPFGDDRAVWAFALAQTHALRGEGALARAYADSVRLIYESRLRDVPQDAQTRVYLGLSLAYLGRRSEAIREGEHAVGLVPFTGEPGLGTNLQHHLTRIYIMVDEPEKALDRLGPLLTTPYFLSPGWLKIDPTFAPLRGNPRFERLVDGE